MKYGLPHVDAGRVCLTKRVLHATAIFCAAVFLSSVEYWLPY